MATVGRLQGLGGDIAQKAACMVASTTNLTLSGAQTVDGIAIGSGERVLVKDQTTATENGIYVSDSSTWTRAKDFNGARDAIPGTIVYVDRGDNHGTSFWVFNNGSTATTIDIDTDSITVSQITIALAGVSNISASALTLSSTTAWKGQLDINDSAYADIGNSGTAVVLADSTGVKWGGIQQWKKGPDIASANDITLPSSGNYFDVTGSVTIQSIDGGGTQAGTRIALRFDSAPLVQHTLTSISLPAEANIQTSSGDIMTFVQRSGNSTDWRMEAHTPYNGWGSGLSTNITALSTTPSTDDFVPIFDVSSTATKRVSKKNLLEWDFISSSQTVTADTILEVAHGLGAVPNNVEVILSNVSSTLGYAANTEVIFGGQASIASDGGVTISRDTVKVTIR